MATWSIPSKTLATAPDASIDSSTGVASFPANTSTTTNNVYTITYDAGNGCTQSTTYTVEKSASTCTCDDFVMDTSLMTFDSSGGTLTRNITSYCGVITVSSNKTWATVSVSNGVISVTTPSYEKLEDVGDREATITVKQDGACDKTFTVKQNESTCYWNEYPETIDIGGFNLPSYEGCSYPPFYLRVSCDVDTKTPFCGEGDVSLRNVYITISKPNNDCIKTNTYTVDHRTALGIGDGSTINVDPYEEGGGYLREFKQNKHILRNFIDGLSVSHENIDLSYGNGTTGYRHTVPMTLV